MKTLFILITCCSFSFIAHSINREKGKETNLPRSEWMKGKYGIMVHWLTPNFDTTKENKSPLPEKGVFKIDLNEAVNGFNVNRFMKDFDQSGAEWLIFTIGQNTGTYASPNSVIDSLAGKERFLDGGAWTGYFEMNATNAEPRGYLAMIQTPDNLINLVSSKNYYRFNLAWLLDNPAFKKYVEFIR